MKKFYKKKLVLVFVLVTVVTSVFGQETWYAKNSGLWTAGENWTLDPSGNDFINPLNDIPEDEDAVVIGAGLEMSVSGNGQIDVQSLTLNGTLKLGTTTGHQMASLSGSGRLILQAFNLPLVSGATPFYTASQDGGTVVFEGGNDITLNSGTLNSSTFYNVELNRSSTAAKVILGTNLTVNGNLDIRQGIFQIGNSTSSRTLTLNGDLMVGNDGTLEVVKQIFYGGFWGLVRQTSVHSIYLFGNISNYGTIDLTANTQPVYRATNTILGAPTEDVHLNYSTLYIKGASNTTLTANGTTNIHRLIIDKDGGDRSYRFTINPSQKEYFRLFGQNDNDLDDKALYIKSGTLELTGATYIHSLTEGGDDFYVPKTGGLWINGSAVEVNSTAISNAAVGFTSVGVNTSTNSGSQSFSVKGFFRITNGELNTQSHGFVAWDGADADATVRIEGGDIFSPGFRSASDNTGKWTYHQSGGMVILKGDVGSDLANQNSATFDLEGDNNVFIMTGGELIIQDASTDENRALNIESAEGNYSVSGGTVRIERSSVSDDQMFSIESTTPFYNLSIGEGGTTQQTNVQLLSSLWVLNDLTIGAQGSLDAMDVSRNISVGRHFAVNTGGVFNSQGNAFTFNGGQSSVVTNGTTGTLRFGNLVVDKEVRFTGNYSVSFAGQGGVEVNKNLLVQRGDFRLDEGKSVSLKGDASLFHGSVIGAGTLNLNGTTEQKLFSDQGKGNSFGNLLVNNSIKLESSALASWVMFGGDKVVDVNKYNLELTSPSRYADAGWSDAKIIRTSGLSSDGGLTLPVGSGAGDVQFFPLGIEGGDLAYARITGAEVLSNNGKVTVVPVNGRHPGAEDAGSGLVEFYFKTNVEFEISSTLQYRFHYPETWNNYPGLVLNNGEWIETTVSKVSQTSTFVIFTEALTLNGYTDFAVGHKNMVKNPRVLESRNNGDWIDASSWTIKATGNQANSAPTQTDIVYIVEDHVITIPVGSGARAGQLIFKSTDETQMPKLIIEPDNGSATFNWVGNANNGSYSLTSGSSFGDVSGRGHIEVQGTTLPSANFTAFLRQEGAVFEYSSGNSMDLPLGSVVVFNGGTNPGTQTLSQLNEYPTLRISGGGTKTGANTDLVIHDNLEVPGASAFQLSTNTNGNLRVNGDVLLDGGKLLLPGSIARQLRVEGNVVVTNSGELAINGNGNAGINHKVYLERDLSLGNGSVALNKAANADVFFSGVKPSVYSAEAGITAGFYRVYIQKPENVKAQFDGGFTVSETVQSLVLVSGIAHLNSTGIDVLLDAGLGDYNIPAQGTLIVTNWAQVRTGGANQGVLLNGKLVVGHNGVANLNEGTNNYVVYSASGKSALTVEGNGQLHIGSQLRRSAQTEAGILQFSQLGAESIIVVGDKDAGEATRGMFEVLNDGSSFRQVAGARLTIKNQKNSTEGYDLHFDPSITSFGNGSAIQVLPGTAADPFDVYAVKPLQGMMVGEDGEGPEVAVRLPLLSLSLNESLTIAEKGQFNAAGRDLIINGSLVNNGVFVAGENTTYFTGTGTISGASEINFFNLIKTTGSGTLALANDVGGVTVNKDFVLEKGRMNTGEASLLVKGDFSMEEGVEVISSGLSEGIIMGGLFRQELSGAGHIARLTINNAEGVVMPTQGGIVHITNALRMNKGVLDIGQNLISFAPAAQVDAINALGPNNMVQTNLSMTDSGILKYLHAGASSFTFPVGYAGKYTPVTLEVTNNSSSNGSVRVKPANEPHITVAEGNRDKVLNYYWTLSSSNLSGFSATAIMEADKADALGLIVDEENYDLARIAANDENWKKPMPGTFSVSGERVVLSFLLDNGEISGDYTAGVLAALPDQVAKYRTNSAGNWNDPIWEKLNTETQNWESTEDNPVGSILYIDHPVTVTENRKTAFRVLFNEHTTAGVLNFGASLNHRLSNVYGTGRIVLATGSLPAADYTDFFSAQGGTMEFSGSGDFPILANIPIVNHLDISGGTKTVAAGLTVRGNLHLTGGTLQQMTSRIEVLGHIERSAGAYNQIVGELHLIGSVGQTVNGGLDLNRMLVRNNSGITMQGGDLVVNNALVLDQGLIHTSSAAMLELGISGTVQRSNTAHFVNGPMRKNQVAGNRFFFPVGKNGRSGEVAVEPDATGRWVGEYFNEEPANRINKGTGVEYVSNNEFWSVQPATGSGASRVYLKWDVSSGVNPSDPALQIINYDADLWQIIPKGAVVASALPTNNQVVFSGFKLFTFGFTQPEEDGELAYPAYTWLGVDSDDWFTGSNWAGGSSPSAHHDVTILKDENISRMPLIYYSPSGLIAMANNLIIQTEATLTLDAGGKLTVFGDMSVADEGALLMKNTTQVNGLSSLLVHGEIIGDARAEGSKGEARIELEFPYDEWYYISQPIQNAKSDIYGMTDSGDPFNTSEAWVNVHRANRWYRIAGGVDIAQLEGLSNKYRPAGGSNYVVSYVGRLNNETIARSFSNRQYYLFGNPYPSSINWQEDKGWERNNIGGTLWYRTRVNGVMTFVTYNRNADPGARAAIYPDGGGFGEEAQLALIPPLQSAWVSSLGASSVSITNEARVHAPEGSFLKSSSSGTTSNVVRITAENSTSRDGTVLYFSVNSEEGIDAGDSEKMFNELASIPEVYTRVGEKAMAINGLPLITESSRTIPLSVRNRQEGGVTLRFDLQYYSGAHAPYLEDRETGAFINLLQENSYTYTVGETGDNHDRFVLNFYYVTTDLESPNENETDAGSNINIKSIAGNVLVSMSPELAQSGNALVEIYTIDGRKVDTVPVRSSRTLLFLPDEKGVYIIRAVANNAVKSQRVINSGK